VRCRCRPQQPPVRPVGKPTGGIRLSAPRDACGSRQQRLPSDAVSGSRSLRNAPIPSPPPAASCPPRLKTAWDTLRSTPRSYAPCEPLLARPLASPGRRSNRSHPTDVCCTPWLAKQPWSPLLLGHGADVLPPATPALGPEQQTSCGPRFAQQPGMHRS
jgi:hypothetical protein